MLASANRLLLALCLVPLLLGMGGCKPKNSYLYEVDKQQLSFPGGYKGKAKTDIEFISVLYSDLYGKSIPQNTLTDLLNIYNANGDKSLATDMIVRGFVNDSQIRIPSASEMRADPGKFVEDCYQRFYIRKPTSYEKWFLTNEIQKQANLTPQLVYYSVCTSAEYKFY